VQHDIDASAKATQGGRRLVIAILSANLVSVIGIVVGAWLVLRLSGAGDEFRRIVEAGFSVDHGRQLAASDPWAMLQGLYLPLTAGVLGSAAIASGLCIGLIAGRRAAVGAALGIFPLYVVTFANGPSAESTVWGCAYVAAATAVAYLFGRRQ
jgi:hypothetical protein